MYAKLHWILTVIMAFSSAGQASRQGDAHSAVRNHWELTGLPAEDLPHNFIISDFTTPYHIRPVVHYGRSQMLQRKI